MGRLLTGIAALFFGTSSAVSFEMNEQQLLGVFQSIQESVQDTQKIRTTLVKQGFRLVEEEQDGQSENFRYLDQSGASEVVVNSRNIDGVVSNAFYSVSLQKSDSDFAHQVVLATHDWIEVLDAKKVSDTNPLAEEGWYAVVWVGEEDSPQVATTVAHNEELQTTRIWGHYMSLSDE